MEDHNYLAHKDDCEILVNSEYKELIDSDGDLLFSVNKDVSDKEIYRILHIANMSYARGVKVGKAQAQQNVQKALGL